MKFLLSAIACVFAMSTAQAATLTAQGASDVDVNGKMYDLEFVDRSCAAEFSGCDDASDFVFDAAGALAANQALLSLIQSTPAINTAPAVMAGCGSSAACYIFTPYSATATNVEFSYLVNLAPAYGTDFVRAYGTFGRANSLEPQPVFVYAKWSEVTVMPLPAAGWMLLGGLGLLAGLRRKTS